jgi:hypothetical protein
MMSEESDGDTRAELERKLAHLIIDLFQEHLSSHPSGLSIAMVTLEEVMSGLLVQLAEINGVPVGEVIDVAIKHLALFTSEMEAGEVRASRDDDRFQLN